MNALVAAVPAVLALIKSLIPSLPGASAGVIASTIAVLEEYGPLAGAEYTALKPIVVGAIEALHANPSTMPEQLAKLRQMAKLYDQGWADSLARARAEDAADSDQA
jgi:hypothetical protein